MQARFVDAVPADVVGHVVGGGFQLLDGISHGDADAGGPDNLVIVHAVAEGDELGQILFLAEIAA